MGPQVLRERSILELPRGGPIPFMACYAPRDPGAVMRYSTEYGSRDLGSGAIGSGYPPSLQQYRFQAGIHDCQLRSNVRRVGFLCVLWLFALLDF